jgi:hypothetical protein
MDRFLPFRNMLFDSYLKECWKRANSAFERTQVIEEKHVKEMNQQPMKVVDTKSSSVYLKIHHNLMESTFMNFY